MGRKRGAAAGGTRHPGGKDRKRGGGRRNTVGEFPPDRLTDLAKEGDAEAFLALVRFHSTFNPAPLTPELLARSSIGKPAQERLLGRLKRKEDRLSRPFPTVNMVFWEEEWVQRVLDRFLWRRRGGKSVPNESFLKRLWDASAEGAMLQLRIYRKASVTPSAWVRVKHPHFANLGLSDLQMLKIARAEGCRFGKEEFLAAVRRFSRRAARPGSRRKAPPR